MYRGTNIERARTYNLRTVFDCIRLLGPVSRAEVARSTKLTPQTISNLVEHLLQHNLVVESGTKQGKLGSPAINLVVNPEGAYSIGIDLSRKHITAILVNLRGDILDRIYHQTDLPKPEAALELIHGASEALLDNNSVSKDLLIGLGVGLPGPLGLSQNGIKGITSSSFAPGWENVPLVEELERLTGVKVILENDATAAAICENLYGSGQTFETFFYVFLSSGLGGGLITEKRPFDGFKGNAGEIAFLHTLSEDGKACYLGDYFKLTDLYARLGENGHTVTTPRDLLPLFESGSQPLESWLDQAAGQLSLALLNIEYILDPEAIIFGGTWPTPMINSLIEGVRTYSELRRIEQKAYAPRLLCGNTGEDATGIGVAFLPFYDQFFPNPHDLMKTKSRGSRVPGLSLAERR